MHFNLSEIVYNISLIFLIIIASFILTKWVGKKFGEDKDLLDKKEEQEEKEKQEEKIS